MRFKCNRNGSFYRVDEFNGADEAYFLTHCHSDHLNGLHNEWGREGNLKIYGSRQTIAILLSKYEGLKKRVKVLSEDGPNLVKVGADHFLNVHMIDANHMPGKQYRSQTWNHMKVLAAEGLVLP